jgi:hypothetical protein
LSGSRLAPRGPRRPNCKCRTYPTKSTAATTSGKRHRQQTAKSSEPTPSPPLVPRHLGGTTNFSSNHLQNGSPLLCLQRWTGLTWANCPHLKEWAATKCRCERPDRRPTARRPTTTSPLLSLSLFLRPVMRYLWPPAQQSKPTLPKLSCTVNSRKKCMFLHQNTPKATSECPFGHLDG